MLRIGLKQTVFMNRDIEGTIIQICSNLKMMVQDMDSGSERSRPLPIERLKNWARESYQEIFREQAMVIIRKLKLDEALSVEEAKLVEEWMVGDIELYQALEGHYEEWKVEILELGERLRVCDNPGVNSDVNCLLRIQTVVIELEHMLRDIDHYRYTMDRIKRFQAFVGKDINMLSHNEKVRLADHMKGMVYSDQS
jgi:hypothetical protein